MLVEPEYVTCPALRHPFCELIWLFVEWLDGAQQLDSIQLTSESLEIKA